VGRKKKEYGLFTLTELKILAVISDGRFDTAEIARLLGLRKDTVGVYRYSIYKKCGVCNMQDLLRLLKTDVVIGDETCLRKQAVDD